VLYSKRAGLAKSDIHLCSRFISAVKLGENHISFKSVFQIAYQYIIVDPAFAVTPYFSFLPEAGKVTPLSKL